MKKWESPAIETLEITNTAWTTVEGEVEDAMYLDCDPLYFGS